MVLTADNGIHATGKGPPALDAESWNASNERPCQTLIEEESKMTLCPIALVAGCRKCPAFSVCPLKGVIGDYKPDDTKTKQHAEKTSGGTTDRDR